MAGPNVADLREGSKWMTGLAAREAAIGGFIPQYSPRGRPILTDVTEAALDRKIAIVREAASDRFDRRPQRPRRTSCASMETAAWSGTGTPESGPDPGARS